MTMPMTAITLDIQINAIRSMMLDNGDTRLIAKELSAKMMKIRNEANHALVMFLAWFFMELKFGFSKPKASLVLAVEPTTEPTLLMLLIKAGYAVIKAGTIVTISY